MVNFLSILSSNAIFLFILKYQQITSRSSTKTNKQIKNIEYVFMNKSMFIIGNSFYERKNKNSLLLTRMQIFYTGAIFNA